MANHTNDVAYSPPHSQPAPSLDTLDSPIPSRATSINADGPLEAPSTTAGRKRKLNNMSARGVANLTPDQLAKKRANDRQAQRAIRERTKGHIDALEQKVRDLSSQKPILDLQAALRQNETIRAENAELRRGLKAAMDIIQPLMAKAEISDALPTLGIPTPTPHLSQRSPFPDSDSFASTGQAHLSEKQYAESLASFDTPSPTHSAPTLGSRRNSTSGCRPPGASFRTALDSQRHNTTHGLDLCSEERLGFNFLLDPSHSIPKIGLRRSSSENFRSSQQKPLSPVHSNASDNTGARGSVAFSAPIQNLAATCPLDTILLDFLQSRQRDAAQGIPRQKLAGPPYPSVSSLLNPEKSVYSHPVSKVFTDILRTFPDISSLPEQVAVLYLMFLLMRWQIYPTQENYERLPEWFTPRSTQLLEAHPVWMDYVPWPAMRDRIVTSYQNYPFENWFIPFTRDLSVNWPYEATDCLLSAGDSDELVINPVFERHMRDLSNWSLGHLFAETYPALAGTARIKSKV